MSDTNVVVLSGRAGKDPEVKSVGSDKTLAVFSIAVNRGYGEKKKTVWANVEVWGKTAEAVGKLVKAGARVTITAEYDEDNWTDNGGNKKSRPKFIASKVDIIDFPEKEKDDEDLPF